MRFIFLLLTLCLVALSALRTSAALPPTVCACTFLLKPVCGTDGISYGNECALQCAIKDAQRESRSLAKAKEGNC